MSSNDLGYFFKLARENKTLLCLGIDPNYSKLGVIFGEEKESEYKNFFYSIIDKLFDEQQISAIKPNYAYFAQHGFDGFEFLKELIDRYRKKIPIILDAKRGDIEKTAEAYAREIYDFWGADATTINPYMGSDSITPFLKEGKLAYVLCKTSNPGSNDFQKLQLEGKADEVLFERIAKKACYDWKCGLVVGATDNSIEKVIKITKGESPLLIPGVGTQGGDLELVMKELKKSPDLFIHKINASSSITYAFEKKGEKGMNAKTNFLKYALEEAERLNKIIRKNLK